MPRRPFAPFGKRSGPVGWLLALLLAPVGVGAEAPTAGALNDLGNQYSRQGEHTKALEAYMESSSLAAAAGDGSLAARASANAARASLDAGNAGRATRLADESYALCKPLGATRSKADLLVNLARTYDRIASGAEGEERAALRLRSHRLLSEAEAVASEIDDPRAASYALGYLGSLYEGAGRFDEALELTRRAAFRAQAAEAPESLYLWHWQTGRLLRAQGRSQDAIRSYESAVAILQTSRQQLASSPGGTTSFDQAVRPVYLELVDLLLRQSEGLAEPESQASLRYARETVEKLRTAEVRDYFRDECVEELRARDIPLEQISGDAAVIYPIVLPDRLEVLATLPGSKLRRFTTAVSSDRIEAEGRTLRRLLEKRTTREYLPHARQLYDWLIRPFESDVRATQASVLVFVPDGPLRTVPMAALHDGERFLVEKWPVAIAPGLRLTEPRSIARDRIRILLAGLSQSAQEFPPLAHVSTELRSVHDLHGGEVFLDESFGTDRLRDSLQEEKFNVVHIATHGEFATNVEDTFLLTYDGRLTARQLEDTVGLFRYRDPPLDLLVLSACETARGDDRAALGLSGVAIKAGARSAVGTLWKVNDQAASELVVEFYRQLADAQISRATALQRAQLHLLGDLRYRHPGYWSQFLLISDWL